MSKNISPLSRVVMGMNGRYILPIGEVRRGFKSDSDDRMTAWRLDSHFPVIAALWNRGLPDFGMKLV